MSKSRTKKSTSTKHVDSLLDAAETAALRINVVIKLIRDESDDDGGYGRATAEDLLLNIQAELRESADAERQQKGVA